LPFWPRKASRLVEPALGFRKRKPPAARREDRWSDNLPCQSNRGHEDIDALLELLDDKEMVALKFSRSNIAGGQVDFCGVGQLQRHSLARPRGVVRGPGQCREPKAAVLLPISCGEPIAGFHVPYRRVHEIEFTDGVVAFGGDWPRGAPPSRRRADPTSPEPSRRPNFEMVYVSSAVSPKRTR